MKPSNSKSAVAARQRKSRQGKKDRAERDKRHAEEFNALSIPEQIEAHAVVKQCMAAAKAGKKERIEMIVEKAARQEAIELRSAGRDGQTVVERIAIPAVLEPAVYAAPTISAPTTLRGEGDPTIRKVLIIRPGSNRREWCDPDQIPARAVQPLANCRTWEAPGSIPAYRVMNSDEWFIRACMARNAY